MQRCPSSIAFQLGERRGPSAPWLQTVPCGRSASCPWWLLISWWRFIDRPPFLVPHPQPCLCLRQLPFQTPAPDSSRRTCCWGTHTQPLNRMGKWNIPHRSGERRKDWRTSLSQRPQASCNWIRFGSTNIYQMPSPEKACFPDSNTIRKVLNKVIHSTLEPSQI